MSEALPVVYLARHGDTAWTLSGQHTGLTDLPLTADGELHARLLGERLQGLKFVKVFTSPLQRAARTCELAGFGAVAEVDPDLVEWNYGEYETLRDLRDPDKVSRLATVPGRLSRRRIATQIAERADRVVQRVRMVGGDVLLFSSGHFIRVLAMESSTINTISVFCSCPRRKGRQRFQACLPTTISKAAPGF